MKNNLTFIAILSMFLCGCANLPTYNPIVGATHQTFLVNESAIAQVKIGMTKDQVHKILGDSLVIGYAQEEPLTIHNPYKTEELKVKEQTYLIEKYVVCINQPDGLISDDELLPLVFLNGQLVGKGKDYLSTLR